MRFFEAVTAAPTDVWDYFSSTIPAGALINGLGLGVLAILFATDRILTKGQHLRRVADIERFHQAILAEKDKAFEIVSASRDGYKEATKVERERADRATDALGEFTELGKLATHLLRSLDEVQKGPKP